ncbi:Metallo-dependent hydrolase [Patellaria atrata CBS 101060]|uniref:Metallo-dependent hydrolase n=1 Tax=Patellaria atrata CBS 101060 TaxID=1346257 RepID=A0A9P4S8J6_9PEZI|nr:Metallo-dependent hydrolase [Patellaria atrata CBS 101060]
MTSLSVVDTELTHALPKIELHAHLTGSISRHCLHQVWQKKKSRDPDLALEDPLVTIPPGKVDFNVKTFFPLFSSYIYHLCDDLQSIIYTTESVLQSFREDNVVYLELRTTPRAIPSNSITEAQYVDVILHCITVSNNINECTHTSTMQTNLILSVDRRNTLEEAYKVIDLAIVRKGKGVVGVDLCGNPEKGDIAIFRPAFERAKEAGLGITLHFAETRASATEDELRELLSWRPDRLGHVIHVNDDLRREIVKRNIGVELCLSCNVHAKLTEGSFEDHHFGWWKESGVGVAICTDDVGIFESPISNEYQLAATHFHLSKVDLKKICESIVDITFANEREKFRLRSIYSNVDWG